MRFVAGWAVMFLALPLCAQVQDESPAPARTYNLLPENDDWSFLGSDQIHPARLRRVLRESRWRNPPSFRAGRK
jgi:hypothetical protein